VGVTELESLLQSSLGRAPSDLLAYFEELASDAFIASGAKERGDLLTADAAISLTRLLDGAHPLMSMLGALVLDESHTSNYHVYLANPPLQGCIMYLSHDGDTRVVYDSPQSLLTAIRVGQGGVADKTNILMRDPDALCSPIVADQTGLARFIEATIDHDDVDMILPVVIGCLELKDTALQRDLATHTDFFVAEALGDAIEKRPTPDLLELADLCAAHPHRQAANAGRRAVQAIRRLNGKPSFWIDGVETAYRSATFSMEIGSDPWLTDAEKGAYGADFRKLIYSLEIDVNEDSEEDGACAPVAQCIPVWRAAGKRHPSLAGLEQLDVDDANDWDAWFGNDAPALQNNRLHFHDWSGATRLQLTWHAELVKSVHGGELEPNAIDFDGEVDFAGIRICVENLEDADHTVKAVWGEAQFAALRRTYETIPNVYRGQRPGLSQLIAGIKRFCGMIASEGSVGERLFVVTYTPTKLPS